MDYRGITTSASGRRLYIPTSRPADPEKDVFISLDDTVRKPKQILNESSRGGDNITFMRAPVAAGKTTLAIYLTTTYKNEFVQVDFGTTEDEWKTNIINASGRDLP